MKKGSMALAMAAAVFGACGCSAEEADTVKAEAEPGKILVAYYSYSGNTRFAAEQIQKATGGTLFEMDAMTILPIMIMIQVTDTITVARLADINPVLFK